MSTLWGVVCFIILVQGVTGLIILMSARDEEDSLPGTFALWVVYTLFLIPVVVLYAFYGNVRTEDEDL